MSFVHGATGTSNLLVIGDDGSRTLVMHHEPEVRLIKPHAQGDGRNEAFHFIANQHRLEPHPFVVVNARVVSVSDHLVVPEPPRHSLCVGHGEAVHDSRSWHPRECAPRATPAARIDRLA